jgi:hypothetical protein
MDDLTSGAGFRAYPNPTDDMITIDYVLTAETDARLEVCNLLGNVLFHKEMACQAPGQYTQTIDVQQAGLSAGVYYLRLFTEENVVGGLIVVQ